MIRQSVADFLIGLAINPEGMPQARPGVEPTSTEKAEAIRRLCDMGRTDAGCKLAIALFEAEM